ncbi:MAG: TMEM165/GDT1 family protein [Thermoanaerobacteraceae bacterium]|nr:TMEM165/GDT1 family protein [Thermoanaerobacteraceae bacterium]
MSVLWTATIFVVLAEMGDKTQLLGMAFATRFRARTVLAGVLVATLLNHFLAVAFGNYLTTIIPLKYVQITAAVSFVIFGLWTIRGDKLEGEDKKNYFSPFWTVTIVFFIAEMGDKTQLASIALAAKYQSFWWVLLGTTLGMMISNIIGILAGVVFGKKIPEKVVKFVSATIFILFGYLGLLEYISDPVIKTWVLAAISIIVAGYIYWLSARVRKGKRDQES